MTSVLTLSEAKHLPGVKKVKRSKYGNKRIVIDGEAFDSEAEYRRWKELLVLERTGKISHLERQPRFNFVIDGRPVVSRSTRYPNGRQICWKGDFAYFDGNHRIIEDVKGMRTKEFILKKAVVEAMFPAVRIVEVKA